MTRATSTLTRPPAWLGQSAPAVARTGPAGPSPARRRGFTAAVTLFTAAVLAGSGVLVWSMLHNPVLPVVTVGDTVRISDLEVTVEDASRRVDAVMGVNTKPKPLSGPAMRMGVGPGMGPQTGSGGSGGSGGMAMASMPGMAGMLEHGEERIDVSLVMYNSGSQPVRLDPGDFTLVSNGEPVALLGETQSEMTRSEVSPGAQMAASITFTIPVEASPLQLEHPDADASVLLDTAALTGSPVQGHGGHGGTGGTW